MLKLLIAEDEQFLREEIRDAIDWMALHCECVGLARNGQEAIDMIKSLQPDIVLLDIKMPYYNGIEVLQATKKEHHYEAIILSGYGEFEYAKRAIQMGVVDYLLKPIDNQALNQSLLVAVQRIFKKQTPRAPFSDELMSVHGQSAYVKSVIQVIKENYQSDISLNWIAMRVGASADYLNRLFKKDTTHTVYQYLLRYRIAQACILLTNLDLRVYEIATMVGFTDYRRFYDMFRKLTKMAPGEYREMLERELE